MKRSILVFLICLLFLLGYPKSVGAHPADMYYHTHHLRFTADGLVVMWEMMPGPMIAQSIWFAVDQDQNDLVSTREAEIWVESMLGAISAELDQQPLNLILDQVTWPEDVEQLYRGEMAITITLKADWPVEIGDAHLFSFHNRFNPKSSLSWFEVIAEDDLGFDLPAQNSGTIAISLGVSLDGSSPERLFRWESGAPVIPWVVESVGLGELAEEAALEGQTTPAEGAGPASILEGLIKSQEGSVPFLLASLVLAALLGALHALSPGHGKTIVAAYLVGSKGKAYHAAALGAIVTLTHTGSVFGMGLITLAASRYFLAADVFPVLEMISGVLILFLGAGLLWPRLRILVRDYKQRTALTRTSGEIAVGGERRLMIDQPIEEPGPAHRHDPSRMGAIPREIPGEDPLENITWRTLIPLAISGGLVPCPDAIAILLVAATINRVGYGLSLILAFSLGLAAILIAVGLLIVQGRKLFERLRWFNRAALVMPIFSALIVLGAGIILSTAAFRNLVPDQGPITIGAGNRRSAVSILDDATVVYTTLDENQRAQLVLRPASGGAPMLITEDQNIWYFVVAPDDGGVVYATDDGEHGSQIWSWDRASNQLELLTACEYAYCSEFSWSPDGQGLLYSRLDFDPEVNPANIQTIWWLNLNTLDSAPLFQDVLTPGFSPRWSPDGKWISYTSVNPLEVKFFHLESAESLSLPSGLGYPALWSPDSSHVILQDTNIAENGPLNKLFTYSMKNDQLTMLAAGENFDDAYPAWSPDGQYLALVRRAWEDGLPKAGNQVWIMGSDGTGARQLTDVENTTFGQPAWSPDGGFLVFDYRKVFDQKISSGVLVLDVQSGEVHEIAPGGNRPAWLE